MEDRSLRCSRRKFLASAAALTIGSGLNPAAAKDPAAATRLSQPAAQARPRTAASRSPSSPPSTGRCPTPITSPAVSCTATPAGGRFHVPPSTLSAPSYVDQTPDNDLSRDLAREFGVRVTRSIADALTGGGDKLAVEGVLLIGEHGNYPRNDKGQILYPRYEMMEQIVEVFRKTGQSVPVFNDKHLSYSWATGPEDDRLGRTS